MVLPIGSGRSRSREDEVDEEAAAKGLDLEGTQGIVHAETETAIDGKISNQMKSEPSVCCVNCEVLTTNHSLSLSPSQKREILFKGKMTSLLVAV